MSDPRSRGAVGRARVVGAGVIGLTTAWCLREDGWEVEVVAAELPAMTTSAVAAAFWYPYLVGPADAVQRWGRVARARFDELARDPIAPVVRRRLRERFRHADVDPGWRRSLPDPVREEVAAPYRDGWAVTTWVADMPRYLAWLVERLTARGVTITEARLASLRDAHDPRGDLVVDCAGVGARTLVPDPTVVAVGGQVVVVRAPSVVDVWLDAGAPEGPTYVVPRTDTVVVGGTAVEAMAAGAEPDPAVAEELLVRGTRLVPALADAEVVGHGLGRRPARPDVRLELEHRSWGTVLHHYGHGGAGMTLSWGSAADAVALARTHSGDVRAP